MRRAQVLAQEHKHEGTGHEGTGHEGTGHKGTGFRYACSVQFIYLFNIHLIMSKIKLQCEWLQAFK